MNRKKRIVTEWPFWPLHTYKYTPRRTFYLAGGLCRRLATEPGFISWPILPYSWIKKYLPKNLTIALDLYRLDRHGYDDVYFIVWGDLKEKAYLLSKLAKKPSRKIIMDFTEDDYQYRKLWGDGHTKFKDFEDYKKTMEKILNIVHYATVDGIGYSKEWGKLGFNVENLIEILDAGDPELFKANPLPREKNILFLKNGLSENEFPVSGLDLLLDSFKLVSEEIPEAKLTVMYIKDPLYAKKLENEYRDLNIDFLDRGVPYIKVPEIISNSYVCVNPISKNEYFMKFKKPNYKLFDYMASGRPVVQTESSDLVIDLFKNEKCGLICRYSPEDMAEKIIKLLDDRKYATELGLNGRKAVEQRHSWDLRVQTIYERVFS